MKKIFLSVLFITALCFVLHAQEGKRVTIGVDLSPSLSWISPKTIDYEKDGAVLGVKIGIPVDINITKTTNYYFHTGVNFEYYGGKLVFPSIVQHGETSLSISELHRRYMAMYLTIPTGIKLKTPAIKEQWVIGFDFGFSHGFLLNSKKKDDYEINKMIVNDRKLMLYEGTAFFKEMVFGGIGVEYLVKDNFKVNIYIRYNYMLNNFFAKDAKNIKLEAKEKANLHAIDFVVGVIF